MSVHFRALNEHTATTYGFQVADWDNRPNTNQLSILGQHEFSLNPPEYPFANAIREHANLHDLKVEAIGKIFNRIIQEYQNCEIRGQRYKPTTIYLRLASGDNIPDEPFLFVAGVKI